MVETIASPLTSRFNYQRLDLKRCVPAFLSSHKILFTLVWIAAFASVFLWQRNAVRGGFAAFWLGPVRPIPKLRPVAFNLTDFGGVGDGVTLNTEAFERAVSAISKLARRGGGQLNVPPGKWLTAPFNLTSHMTLFLAEDAVILGIQDEKYWPLMPPLPSYGYGREHPGPRYGSLIHGQNLRDIVITGPDFPASSCNKKLIGARAFHKGYITHKGRLIDESKESASPRDTEGHGTHTATTAAGSLAHNVSLFQYATGEARGMASKARIAAYKICWSSGCYDSDILAAMDQAIYDGVHVISLSVGAIGHAPKYDHDSIAIGAFSASQHGIVVSCSAGNAGPGPGPYTAVNIAPWILTVGASTIDREFPHKQIAQG